MTVFEHFNTLCVAKGDRAATGIDWNVFLDPDRVVDAAEQLKHLDFHLESVHAIDAAEGMLVNYLFDHFEKRERVCLRVLLDHTDAEVDSIAGVFQGAEWHERETYDFHGIMFRGNPNMVNLLLPAESDIHPLVKAAKKRFTLVELLNCGEIVSRADGFDLLDEKTEEAAQ
ncbi:NADH-quinone oxidoreductase subunit C [Pseudodesulfovibrio senegalensis]|jgi:NADH-quinone oxidoreductase subunit C|uniref:NADH-quinone oxidoreductase subunit C n=1 Tax=Pseudodesulfovibrio senegalensis TaxID=1721087 RepID=A0A6N6N637_9BACT|nr:NADH-quinone oxidoreductase subunit C [Pseudodesulfovibrio senegalensis]KAB1443486.1 NADH-quinone oxidoreductase subunit C [Pseudodesulfovibrio senegalensis]